LTLFGKKIIIHIKLSRNLQALVVKNLKAKRVLKMYVKEVLVQNKAGLHARPATFFIQKANEYKSTIWVEKEERRVNAKSLLGVLSLGIIGGTTIKVIADGSDETEAVEGTKLIPPKVPVKYDKLLREFIVSGGFDLKMPKES
jgi:phosphocarrier protein